MSLKGKTNAWIKPSGQFIAVGYMCHNEWASDYFKEKYGWDDFMDKINELNGGYLGYSYQALHKLGWIRLLTWSDGETVALGDCMPHPGTLDTEDPKSTSKQKETLMDWCIDNDFNYDKLFDNK